MINGFEVREESTLASVADHPDPNAHYLLFGVVVEISEPTKSEECSNYLTKIKIIDPSFNYRQELDLPQLKFVKYAFISIYSETPESAPKIKYVGEIIRLRRFRFKYSDKGELKGYEQKFSNWLIYGGLTKDSFVATSYKNYLKNQNRELNPYEKGRLCDLRFWAEHFFGSNSVRYITWWNDVPQLEEGQDLARSKHTETNKDLILKVTKVDVNKKRLSFIDNKGRAFELATETTSALKLDQVVELKCVDLAWESHKGQLVRVITLTAHSSCLYIHPFFFDSKNFEKFEKVEHHDRFESESLKKLSKKFEFLQDFTTEIGQKGKKSIKKGEEIEPISAVRASFFGAEVTPISELQKILASNPQAHLSQKFLLQAKIVSFKSLDKNEIIKRYFTQEKKIGSLSDKEADKKQRIVYHLVPSLEDESVRLGQSLQVYILSNEFEHFIFDSWEILPPHNDIQAWNTIKSAKIDQFIQRLEQVEKRRMKVNVVVQLMLTKSNHFFFKVVDTVFIPF